MTNTDKLSELFFQCYKINPEDILKLPGSGSARRYYRMISKEISVIGAFNADISENEAFIYFSRHFKKIGLSVPEIIAYNKSSGIYIIEDLGDTTLFSLLSNNRETETLGNYYKQSLANLVKFQTDGFRNLNLSYCYPRKEFDAQSIQWDLNYFKYYFLKTSGIHFDEQKLENSFQHLINDLLQAPKNYFMYRDFQSRNIMIRNKETFFIDYQGGRKGPLAYDVVSLLYQARANLSEDFRHEMLEFYIQEISKKLNSDIIRSFKDHYKEFILIRLLQVLGAYGYRGYFQGKSHFISSIPFALRILETLCKTASFRTEYDYLLSVLREVEEMDIPDTTGSNNKLAIRISSFSYKQGIPADYSGNGGGYVFDCRALPNPGREDKYKNLTGRDQEVIDYLKASNQVNIFFEQVFKLVDQSIENYLKRGFSNLMVNFGCTGGQHRSVYCAEKLNDHIKSKFGIKTHLVHTQLSGDKYGKNTL